MAISIHSLLVVSLLLPWQMLPLGLGAIAQTAPVSTPHPPTASSSVCPADLPGRITAIITRPEFQRAGWGILVQTQSDRPQTLYAHESDRYFIPASNTKLFTTAAALLRLGADYRIRTSIYQDVTPADQIVLRLVGRGDPSLNDRDLQTLAAQVRQALLRQLSLDKPTDPLMIDRLVIDDRYFGSDTLNPTWEWEDLQAGYGAAANSLILNENLIGFTLMPQQLGDPLGVQWDDPAEANRWQVQNRSRTVMSNAPEFLVVGRDLMRPVLQVRGQLRLGSAPEPVAVSNPQPSQYFLQKFRQTLNSLNIRVRATALLTRAEPQFSNPQPSEPQPAPNAKEIAAIESPPLSELLIEANQNSNNLYAEALLRALGRVGSLDLTGSELDRPTLMHSEANLAQQNPDSGLEAGLTALRETLTQLGVDSNTYDLSDGSGLSRQNLVTPVALVTLLQLMNRSSSNETYRASLSVAGRSGTLRNRFRDTAIAGQLQGKTGFLTHIGALSGYLDPPEFEPIVFSIVVNQANQGESQAAIDEIVQLLGQLYIC